MAISLLTSCVYSTHPQNQHQRHNLSHHRQIDTQDHHWVYVEGYQQHGVWVSHRWVRRPGRHPYAHQDGWNRIPGRWFGHGRSRVWVQPHWERGAHCRHRR